VLWRQLCVNTELLLPSPPLSERRYCVAGHHTVTLWVCPPSGLYHVSTARRISLGGEGNALYPVLSSYKIVKAHFRSYAHRPWWKVVTNWKRSNQMCRVYMPLLLSQITTCRISCAVSGQVNKCIGLNDGRDDIPHPCLVNWLQPSFMEFNKVSRNAVKICTRKTLRQH